MFEAIRAKSCLASLMLCLFPLLLPAPSALAEPAVYWASDPVEPDDTVLVTGADLDGITAVTISRLRDDPDSGGTALTETRPAAILDQSPTSLKFVVPADFAAGVYYVDLLHAGAPSTIVLNKPTVYWAQGDQGDSATPGGWIRVMGRNIARTPDAKLILTDASGETTEIIAKEADLWASTFALPATLKPGLTNLRLWNGNGDETTWQDAGTVEIALAPAKPDTVAPLYPLATRRDKIQDDANRINFALEALARRGGGTLLLQRGYYRLQSTLRIPPNVILKGVSRDVVRLVWRDSETPPDVLIEGSSDFALEDLTISASRHFDIIRGGFASAGQEATGKNIAIRRVTVRASAYRGRLEGDAVFARFTALTKRKTPWASALAFSGRDIVIEDCDILSSMRSLYLVNPRNAVITGSIFRNGQRGWYSIQGANRLIFEDNVVEGADLQATGGGVNLLGPSGRQSQNVLFRKNILKSMYGWDREAFTTDGPGGFFYGKVNPLGTAALELDPAGVNPKSQPNWRDAGLFVLAGRGQGQWARIDKRDGSRVILQEPLKTPLDASSLITIVRWQARYLVVDNEFIDVGHAAQIYGTAIEHVFANNRAERSFGFASTGLNYGYPQASWYSQFIGNEIAVSDVENPSSILIAGQRDKVMALPVLNYGSVVRANRLMGNSSIRIDGFDAKNPGVSEVVIERNEIRDVDQGIVIGKGVTSAVIRNNTFQSVREPVVGQKR